MLKKLLLASLLMTMTMTAENRVFEMRTYTTVDGRLDALLTRFRDHTIKLFEKHGMTNIAYWVPQDAPLSKNTLVYVLAYPNRDAAKKSWDAFRADPVWQKAQKESEASGKIVDHVVSVFMDPAEVRVLDVRPADRHLLLLAVALVSGQAQQSSLAIINARVWTGNPAQPWAEAISATRETITAVGANEQIKRETGPQTRVIDAKGQLVVPGFIDSHIHFLEGGLSLSSVQLRNAKTKSEFIARFKDPGGWVPQQKIKVEEALHVAVVISGFVIIEHSRSRQLSL